MSENHNKAFLALYGSRTRDLQTHMGHGPSPAPLNGSPGVYDFCTRSRAHSKQRYVCRVSATIQSIHSLPSRLKAQLGAKNKPKQEMPQQGKEPKKNEVHGQGRNEVHRQGRKPGPREVTRQGPGSGLTSLRQLPPLAVPMTWPWGRWIKSRLLRPTRSPPVHSAHC